MGNISFAMCPKCEYASWLEDWELLEFIRVHHQHVIAIIPCTVLTDSSAFEKIFRVILGWPVEEED